MDHSRIWLIDYDQGSVFIFIWRLLGFSKALCFKFSLKDCETFRGYKFYLKNFMPQVKLRSARNCIFLRLRFLQYTVI